MALPTVVEFREQFPEFVAADYPDATVERFIEVAAFIHNVRQIAHLYLTAHLLKLEDGRDAGAAASSEVQSEGAGPLRVTYKTQAEDGDEAFYTRTEYGRTFLTMEKRTPRAIIGAVVPRAKWRG